MTLKFLTICCEVGSPDRYITGESPPRAWRARLQADRGVARGRTTSTCVESTEAVYGRLLRPPDHLHVRGEHSAGAANPRQRVGPPPRAWRALRLLRQPSAPVRTTSTCVESTSQLHQPLGQLPDHLHVRGEHRWAHMLGFRGHGPPPRAWRARHHLVVVGVPQRTTSTCVESTSP